MTEHPFANAWRIVQQYYEPPSSDDDLDTRGQEGAAIESLAALKCGDERSTFDKSIFGRLCAAGHRIQPYFVALPCAEDPGQLTLGPAARWAAVHQISLWNETRNLLSVDRLPSSNTTKFFASLNDLYRKPGTQPGMNGLHASFRDVLSTKNQQAQRIVPWPIRLHHQAEKIELEPRAIIYLREEIDLREGTRANWGEWIARGDELVGAWVNEVRKARGRPALVHEDLCKPMTGEHAFEDYLDFLTSRAAPIYTVPLPGAPQVEMIRPLAANADRNNLCEEILNWFDADVHVSAIARNVYAPGMWKGLAAFGEEIAHRYEKLVRETVRNRNKRQKSAAALARQPCIHIPLGPFAKSVDSDLPTPYVGGVRLVLWLLWRHFGANGDENVAGSNEHFEALSVETIIADIRFGMLRQPSILIISGLHYPAPDDEDRAARLLEQFMAGETVLGYLSRVLDFPLAALQSQAALDQLKRNRVLLISDNSLQQGDNGGWTLAHARDGDSPGLVAQKLPDPAADDAEAIIRSHDLRNADFALAIRDGFPTHSRVRLRDAEYFAIDAAYSLLTTFVGETEENAKRVIRGALRDTFDYRSIIESGLPVKNANQLGVVYGILYMIALVPEGLRRATLQRAVTSMLTIGDQYVLFRFEDLVRFCHQYDGGKYTDGVSTMVEHAINTLLHNLPSLLREIKEDHYEGLGAAQGAPAVTFMFSEFRETIIRKLEQGGRHQSLPDMARRVICRILSREAFDQQSSALRVVGTRDDLVLLNWQRQISGILLGLRSIPLISDGHNVSISSALDECFGGFPSQFVNSEDFYAWLYHFAYQGQLEQTPDFLLSRRYGANRLKRQLLRAFEQPWSLLDNGQTFPARASLVETSLSRWPASYASHLKGVMAADAWAGRIVEDDLRRLIDAAIDSTEDFRLSAIKGAFDAIILRKETMAAFGDDLIRLTGRTQDDTNDYAQNLFGQHASDALIGGVHEMAGQIIGYVFGSKIQLGGIDFKAKQLVSDMLEKNEGSRFDFEKPKSLGRVAAIVGRLADVNAFAADFKVHKNLYDQVKDLNAAEVCSALESRSILWPKEPSSNAGILAMFATSLSLFLVAERLQIAGFLGEPIRSLTGPSPHSLRQAIRTSVKLEKIRRAVGQHAIAPSTEEYPWLIVEARRWLDVLTRTAAKFPHERAGMLVIQASFDRLLSVYGDRSEPASAGVDPTQDPAQRERTANQRQELEALQRARSELVAAEALLATVGHGSQRRLRLALERTKVHRALSHYYANQFETEHALFYHDLAELDVKHLCAQHPPDAGGVWSEFAKRQKEQLKLLRLPKKISAGSSAV